MERDTEIGELAPTWTVGGLRQLLVGLSGGHLGGVVLSQNGPGRGPAGTVAENPKRQSPKERFT